MGNQNLFGNTLRALRERTAPAAVGLPLSGRRRTRGLRREELAGLAGVSADYVRRLEQGRSHPSADVVNSIARALRVDHREYEYLCTLAGHAAAGGRMPRSLSAGARGLLERLSDTPVCICDPALTVLAGNHAWEALQCGDLTGHTWDWNLVWRTFGDAPSRVRRTQAQQAEFEVMLVAELRATSLRYPDDETLFFLIDDMRKMSRAFSDLWQAKSLTSSRQLHRATLVQDGASEMPLDCDLVTVRDSDLRAVIFTPHAEADGAGRLGPRS